MLFLWRLQTPENSEKIYEVEDLLQAFDGLQKTTRSFFCSLFTQYKCSEVVTNPWFCPSLLAEYWKTTRGSRGNATRAKRRAWSWKWTIFKMRTASFKTCSRKKVTSMRWFTKKCPGSAVRIQCVMAFFSPHLTSQARWVVCRTYSDLWCPFFLFVWMSLTGDTRDESAGFRTAETKTRTKGSCRREEHRTGR